MCSISLNYVQMPKCRVLNSHGVQCCAKALHEYNGRPLCEKHWNNGFLTENQPAEEIFEARRRIAALKEMPIITEIVMSYVVKKKTTTGQQMADFTKFLANLSGVMNRQETRDLTRLIVTTVRLNRASTSDKTERAAFVQLAGMIQELYKQ